MDGGVEGGGNFFEEGKRRVETRVFYTRNDSLSSVGFFGKFFL